jgi:dihydroorotate dehydrogenase electron transfer subunit
MGTHASLMTAVIAANREVAPENFLMTLAVPPEFAVPEPGQFVMVRDARVRDPFLARPLSVHAFARTEREAHMELLYRVAGRGTRMFSLLRGNDCLELTGPLGRPFVMDRERSTHILVAGGIGVAPLAFLAARLRELGHGSRGRIIAYLGAQSEGALVGVQRLEEACNRVAVCTDDGSRGFRGPVTELLAAELDGCDPEDTTMYVCGPLLMAERLAHLLRGRPFRCQAALEEHMACGVGACLGCALEITEPSGASRYVRVCKEGPVFDIRDVFPRQCGEAGAVCR